MAVVHPRLIVPGSDGVHDDPVFTSDILPLSPHGANMIALSVVLLFLTGLWTLSMLPPETQLLLDRESNVALSATQP